MPYSKVCHSKTDITLEPHSSFVFNTELRKSDASLLSPARIPALCPILYPLLEKDRGFCPVRALLPLEDPEHRKLLFVSYKAGHKGCINKNMVSSWVRKLL